MRAGFSELKDAPSIDLKVRHGEQLNSLTANKLAGQLDSFNRKHAEKFRNAYMGLDIKKSGIQVRGVKEYECRVNMVTDKGNFHATAKGIGVVGAVSEALCDVESQLEKKMAKLNAKVSARERDPYTVTEEN